MAVRRPSPAVAAAAHGASPVRRRPPVVADVVAQSLRRAIVRGELADGDELPMQDDLIRRFQVSKAAVREALRVLEAEGLVTVRRGAVGGAVVHGPTPEQAAYTLAMLLESRRATLGDVGEALLAVEPACAVLAASRSDRARTVLPRLRRIHEEMGDALEDGPEAVACSRRWHEALVEGCGNQTLIALIGVLEVLWSQHEAHWAADAEAGGSFPPLDVRRRAWQQHGEILEQIAAGDAEAVPTSVRRHLAEFQCYPLSKGPSTPIEAAEVRRPPFTDLGPADSGLAG